MKLLIVESPSKIKTFQKVLGSEFIVSACFGHVADLPKGEFGIDIEKDFLPEWKLLPKKSALIKKLKAEAGRSDSVYLATDPDREGEAIAWHLQRLLGRRKYFRVRCTEITESGIKNAIQNISEVRSETVDSQISRRLVDRIIGYRISPKLWDIRSGLSAGRVQSVALKWIVHREREIRKFIPEDYYEISLKTEVSGTPVVFKFVQKANPSSPRLSPDEKNRILSAFGLTEIQSGKDAVLNPGAEIKIISQNDKIIKKYSPPPFTTSSLQKEAYSRFKMPVSKTMRIAQKLYEGGTEKGGLITYMRTDSTRVSTERKNRAVNYLKSEGYDDFFFRKQKDSSSSQDAHEAIQPVNPYMDEKKLTNVLTKDELQIYSLIRNRFLESFLPPAVYREYSWTAESKGFPLTASKEFCIEPGYLNFRKEKIAEKSPDFQLKKNDILISKIIHFKKDKTEPPPRFTEASLVDKLEKTGIGRPSTYSAVIETLLKRKYAERSQKSLHPTDLGERVTERMEEVFSSIIEDGYTAEMEKELDEIESGQKKKISFLSEFYKKFLEMLNNEKKAKKEFKKIQIPCPLCKQGHLLKKITKKDRSYHMCSRYPDCEYMEYL